MALEVTGPFGDKFRIAWLHSAPDAHRHSQPIPNPDVESTFNRQYVNYLARRRRRRISMCVIMIREMGDDRIIAPTWRILSVGEATCSKKDQFTKAQGRRYSLSDAIGQSILEDDERQAIWYTFFAQWPVEKYYKHKA